MAVGKSTIGPRVARDLGLPFVDLDAVVVAETGRSIQAVFSEDGEAAFRAMELRALGALLAGPPRVIALGGGTLHQPCCLALLAPHTVRVLVAPWAVIAQRLDARSRPLAPQAATLFRQRAAGYAAAGPAVEVGGLDVDGATERVLRSLGAA